YEDSELVAFYELRILSDGGVGLVRRDTRTGEEIWIFSGSSEAINQGNAINQVETIMLELNFILYINGVNVLETPLPEYSGGGIGLGCASGEEGTVQYKFYDFSAGH
ncbi:MAG: hypothetical protein HYX86_04985, partial [Chloroflexi bacterium]|nr:hypothetical protein [Chloroflexota bacterium]